MVRLDGLRGVAVLSVLLFHAGYFLIPSLDANLLPGGFIGVDLFFVLSGFLMTHILLDRSQNYRAFYLRRVARIFPALYLFMLADLVYMWSTGTGVVGRLRSDVLIGLGMANWGDHFRVTLPFDLGQTWSLGVEEQLYLLWPLALIGLGRRNPKMVGRLCLLGIAAAFITKFAMFKSGMPTYHIYGQTEARLDDFLAGAFVATLWVRQPSPVRDTRGLRLLAALAGIGLIGALAMAHPYTSKWLYEGGFTAIAICGAVILYASLHEVGGTGFLGGRFLRTAGRYSYSIYLWHTLVIMVASHFLPHDLVLRVLFTAVVLASASVLSTRAVEEPLRRWVARRAVQHVKAPPVLAPPVLAAPVLPALVPPVAEAVASG
jgi:peptidoglycan/LPS O-acetylase OafA/YrhL